MKSKKSKLRLKSELSHPCITMNNNDKLSPIGNIPPSITTVNLSNIIIIIIVTFKVNVSKLH